MRLKSRVCVVLLMALCSVHSFSGTALAQIRNQILVGARPRSMGDAFVAVADDGNAIYWNPAGLARMERIQASFNYEDLFGIGIDSYYASFISRLYFIPLLTDYLTFGVDWFGIQTPPEDKELSFEQNQFHFALGIKPPKSWPFIRDLGLGVNAKYLSFESKLDGNIEADANGWGWDLGLMYNLGALPILPEGLNAGLMVHDIAGTEVNDKTDVSEEIYSQNIRWGFSYRPFEQWPGGKIPISDPVFALDFDDRVHFGLEFWIAKVLAFRAGIQDDFGDDEGATLSFGIGFRLRSKSVPDLTVDYALTDSPVLPNTKRQFGTSLIIRNDPRLIRLEGAHVDDIFSSLYLHYDRPSASVGTIELRNVSSDTLRAWISFEENRFMQPHVIETVEIAPEVPVHVPLRAAFKRVLFRAQSGRLTARLKVSYNYKKTEFSTTATLDFNVYEKNYLTWDDPAKAAAFVTFNDETLRKFNAKVMGNNAIGESHWFMNYSMANALRIYHALKAYGFTYRKDPVTPFPDLDKYRPDTIYYPSQLLRRIDREDRAGDCDDLAVLYAGLLQTAGIPTALVSQPTHLFMMFDTGISESQSRVLPVPPDRFVRHAGNLWIPIDAAQIPNMSFTQAWTRGADKFNSAAVDTFFEVAAAQKIYPAPKLRYRKQRKFIIPDYARELQNDLDALDEWEERFYMAFEDSLRAESLSKSEEVKIRNKYGVLLGKNGEYVRAKLQFEKVLAHSTDSAPAWNNLANVEFILGNFDQAETHYTNALQNAVFDHGVYLNRAILYQMMMAKATPAEADLYQRKSERDIDQAARLFRGDAKNAFVFLGYPGDGEQQREVKAEGFIDSIRDRIEKVKKFVDKSFIKLTNSGQKKVVLDRGGSKGEGEVDEYRWALLWWSY